MTFSLGDESTSFVGDLSGELASRREDEDTAVVKGVALRVGADLCEVSDARLDGRGKE